MRKSLLLISILCATAWAAKAQSAATAAADSTVTVTERAVEAPGQEPQTREQYPMVNYDGARKYIVNNVTLHGVQYLDSSSLLLMSGIRKGDEVYVPSDYIAQAIRSFWKRGYFSQVEIVGEPVGDSINFEIYFKERPIVFNWNLNGVRKGQAKELKDKMSLKPAGELSDFIVNKNENYLRNYFIEKGFRNAQVNTRIENDPTRTNAVSVSFDVERGERVRIGAITFGGNEEFSDKRLRKAFKKTHKKSLNFLQNSKFKDKEYDEDKELLLDFYNSKGYRNANIVSDSIYDINSKRIGIHIDVTEGNKYYFRNISWVGNSVYGTRELQQLLGVHPGDIYDKRALNKRLGIGKDANIEDMTAISSLYQNNGYLFSTIEPAETIIGADSIDLEIKIFEGKQATINEVSISGNYRVDDEVIRRELYTRPGELYDRSLLMATLRQLSQMQHFNPESLMPGIQPVGSELVDISFPLEDQPSDRAEISGGWGSGMFVASVGLELNNLSIRNFFKKGAWRPYPHGQNQQLRIKAQSNGSYYKSFQISFTEPWLGGKKPNALTVGTSYSDETDAYYAWQRGNKHFRTVGVYVGLGRRLNWPDQYFTLYNEISYQSYNLQDWDYFIFNNGSSNILAFTTTFGRNSIDQPLYPREGSDFSITLSLTPPYSLWDGKDYDDKELPDRDRYKWIEYHKWKLKGEWYIPLSANRNLVLRTHAEMGYIGSYDNNKKSPFEGFDVGGDGMSGYNLYGVDVVGMRGYDDSGLNPYSPIGDYARAYHKYTMELRYPFMLKPSTTIYGLVFAEGGNAFSDWNRFNPFDVKRSVGVGLRLYLPIVGMLGIDWGYGFDRNVGDRSKSGGHIHYSIGMSF